MRDFVVKNVTKDDLPTLILLIQELADYENASNRITLNVEKMTQCFFSESPIAYALLVYDNGQPIGYAIYYFIYSSYSCSPGLYIEDIYVLPKERGKKVGKKIMAHLASIAKQHHCEFLKWSVLDWNQPAIDFYKKLGAKHASDVQGYTLKGDKFFSLINYAS